MGPSARDHLVYEHPIFNLAQGSVRDTATGLASERDTRRAGENSSSTLQSSYHVRSNISGHGYTVRIGYAAA